jgi:hypothetical protein
MMRSAFCQCTPGSPADQCCHLGHTHDSKDLLAAIVCRVRSVTHSYCADTPCRMVVFAVCVVQQSLLLLCQVVSVRISAVLVAQRSALIRWRSSSAGSHTSHCTVRYGTVRYCANTPCLCCVCSHDFVSTHNKGTACRHHMAAAGHWPPNNLTSPNLTSPNPTTLQAPT